MQITVTDSESDGFHPLIQDTNERNRLIRSQMRKLEEPMQLTRVSHLNPAAMSASSLSSVANPFKKLKIKGKKAAMNPKAA